jgi:hypothetical protein
MRLTHLAVFGLWLLLSLPALAQTIPDGTRLAVRLDANVSSGTAQVGDIVPASLAWDLVLNNHVLARAGTPLRGKVT